MRSDGRAEGPQIVGVVNVTPDSFSDGGTYLDPDRAAAHARQLARDGADWIELGAASSHPEAQPVAPDEEIRRLSGVLGRLRPEGLPVGVDSAQTRTQRYALAEKVGLLNDVAGFADPAFYPELADADCLLVVMHRATGSDRADGDPLDRVLRFLEDRVGALERAGVAPGRIVVDPGMGLFLDPAPEASIEVLQGLDRLRRGLGLPVLVGVSRKSFLGALTGRPIAERGPATLAAELYAAAHGADYIRTHDVRALRDALRVQRALRGGAA